MVLTMLVLACVPTSVDNSADDYLTLRSGPAQLVDDDGVYIGGWWDDFDGTINRDTAQGADGAWKGWIHLNLTTDRYFISSNLADLNSAANTALLVPITGSIYDPVSNSVLVPGTSAQESPLSVLRMMASLPKPAG